ncbi:MAG: TrkA family potassium uptake protein [Coriobacteriia bacterium]|nr:TrkA family potassium uptake protein [Coriobacteriia bacterium]
MYVVIAGGGKIGEYLAGVLLDDGNDVALIEKSEVIAKRLSENLQGSVLIINGDACETTIQESAGVHRADVFVAITGRDEDNLAACEIADRLYRVPRCVARVNSPKNLRIFRRLGIECISSTSMIARMIQEEATMGSMTVAVALTNDDLALESIMAPRTFKRNSSETGVLALDLDEYFRDGIRLVAVNHGDDIEVVGSETRIMPGDHVILAADTDKLDIARRVIKGL